MLSLVRLNRSVLQLSGSKSSLILITKLRPKRASQSVYNMCKIFKRDVQSFSFVQAFDQGLANTNFVDHDAKDNNGLFGITGLQKPSHWMDLAKKSVYNCNMIIEELKDSNFLPSPDIVRKLDTISDQLCYIADSAELCRHVHPDPKFAQAADEASMLMQSFVASLNTNTVLYEAARQAIERKGDLTEEQLIVITQLKDEFEHKGVHLSEKDRAILQEKFARLQTLQSQFIYMNNNPDAYGRFGVDKKILQQMPRLAKLFPVKNGKLVIDLSSEVVNGILAKVDDEQIRKDVYTAAYQPDKRLTVLDQMLSLRQEIAEFLNFPSYSHMHAVHRILKTPQQVMDFLQNLNEKLAPILKDELNGIRELKGLYASVTQGNSDHSAVTSESVQSLDVNAWDKDYYRSMMRQIKINDPISNIPEYFSLGQCWEGLRVISNKLFGIQMNVVQATPNEIWDPYVRKVEVVDEKDSKLLGYLYLDMLARDSKFGGGANFPLRFRSMHNDVARVAVITNFMKPKSGRPTLLSFSEVETLFHEFGHILQTLFSTNELQHFSGTRSYNDFVETASTLMENWIWDYNVVSQFAKHYKTGEVLPEKALQQLRAVKTMFKAMDTQDQVHLSAVDQYLHSGPVLSGKTSTQVIGQLDQFSPVKFPAGVAPHKYFGHLDSYGSFYYTYLYSTLISTNIWEKCFARDPLSREAGERYRRELLAYGGAKDPLVMVKKLLGGDPSVDVFVGSLKK